jgi:hypothetical protein
VTALLAPASAAASAAPLLASGDCACPCGACSCASCWLLLVLLRLVLVVLLLRLLLLWLLLAALLPLLSFLPRPLLSSAPPAASIIPLE